MPGLKLKHEKRGIQMENKTKFYQKTWFMWIMLVIFAPIGIALMWIYHKKYFNGIKITLSIVFGAFFIMMLLVDENSEPDQENFAEYTQTPARSTEIPRSNPRSNPPAEPTKNVTPISSEPVFENVFNIEPTANPEDETELSPFQLISMKGHPVLYDYLSDAHDFWDDYSNGRIDFPDDYFDDYLSEKTVLVIDTYSASVYNAKEKVINSFEIYPNKKISLKKGLELTKSYLPIELMKKWYTLKHCDRYHFEDDKAGVYYYSALYVPTKKGKKAIKKLKVKYNYVSILIYVKNNKVLNIEIGTVYHTPHWRTGVELKTKKWSYDFLK